MAEDIDRTWTNLLTLSINVDISVDELQRIAILYSRCGNDRHQDRWNAPDSDLQCIAREKVSEIKRGNHPHRICKRRPQPDDNEIVTFLDGNWGTTLKERCKNGKLTKGELRDIQHKYRKGCSGRRIKVHDYGSKHHYDPRIDIASTKPSDCNKELQKLLQDILPDNYGSIKRHKVDSASDQNWACDQKGVDERHIKNGIDTLIRQINNSSKNIRKLADDFSCYSVEEFIHHPYHHHKIILSNICNELDSITNNLCQELEFVGKLYGTAITLSITPFHRLIQPP